MSRSIIKPILLSCGLALNLVALSFAQNAPALDTNFDPSMHDVTLVPRLPGASSESLDSKPNLDVVEQTHHDPANHRPTIIVRPAIGNPDCLNECKLEVEPLSPSEENRFRLKLSIPESVEIVELLPQHSGDQARQVQVLFDPVPEPVDSVASMNEQSEFRNESSQLVANEEAKSKFKANPFFADELAPGGGEQHRSAEAAVGNNDFVPSPFRLTSTKAPEVPAVLAAELTARTQFPLETNIIGPRSLEAGASAEFEINLKNPSPTDYQDVLVQLQLPAGFEPRLLDRTAWLDKSRRTLSWKLDELKSGQLEVIHYAVVATAPGTQLQKVTVGIDELTQGEADIQTLTTSPFKTPGDVVHDNLSLPSDGE